MVELLTAAQSEEQQRNVAGALRARGLVAGDRVALLTSSSGAMLSAILGSLRVGVIPVLLNSGLLEEERRLLIADAQPQLIVDDELLTALLEGPATDLADHPLGRPMHYTSGTTGVPKGVWSGVLDETDGRLLFEEEAELWGFEPSDRQLICSPFHHSVAIRFGGTTLLAGGDVVILDKFDARVAAEAIGALRPSYAFMVPAHLQRLFALGELPDLSCFRRMVHAGAPCPEHLKLAAIETFGAESVWEFYGSTEGQFSACSALEWLDHRGTVGRARPHRRLWVEPTGEDAPADPDEPGGRRGVVWCEVPAYARWEYWRDPVKTATAWRETDTGRAFTVRDLGRVDEDGYLYLDGRRDDLIITGGVNVYPVEIERVIASAPGVASVAVFGVDDERWGQRVCAAVVAEPSGVEPDTGAVMAYARERLAGYKCPKDVFLVDELPYTVTGKLQRLQLPERLGL